MGKLSDSHLNHLHFMVQFFGVHLRLLDQQNLNVDNVG